MKVRGRNGKWLGTGNRGVVWVIGVNMVCQFGPGIALVGGGMDVFVILNIIERRAQVGHHECIRSEDRSRSGRGLVNRKEGTNGGELAVDFFFLNVEETSDVLNHLLMGECQFVAGRTVRRRRGDKVRGVASAVSGGRRTGWNENGGRGARHRWAIVWYVASKGGG